MNRNLPPIACQSHSCPYEAFYVYTLALRSWKIESWNVQKKNGSDESLPGIRNLPRLLQRILILRIHSFVPLYKQLKATRLNEFCDCSLSLSLSFVCFLTGNASERYYQLVMELIATQVFLFPGYIWPPGSSSESPQRDKPGLQLETQTAPDTNKLPHGSYFTAVWKLHPAGSPNLYTLESSRRERGCCRCSG